MTGIEIFLLLIGCIFMIGSFFMTEKLSASEVNKIAELSESELKRIINREIENAGGRIDEVIEEKIGETSDVVERSMEKESNEKIMAISEYSDTVIDTMKKTHDEIMFLYSMLNDKHTELTSMTGDLQKLAAEIRSVNGNLARASTENKKAAEAPQAVKVRKIVPEAQNNSPEKTEKTQQKSVEVKKPDDTKTEELALENHNEMILKLYNEGMEKVDIARKLGLGLGEVKLVIGLYKGDESL